MLVHAHAVVVQEVAHLDQAVQQTAHVPHLRTPQLQGPTRRPAHPHVPRHVGLPEADQQSGAVLRREALPGAMLADEGGVREVEEAGDT